MTTKSLVSEHSSLREPLSAFAAARDPQLSDLAGDDGASL